MTVIAGTTRAQTIFLRACSADPSGLNPRHWPTPATFRKWMRHPEFSAAIDSMRDALQLQADLHLTVAAAAAAQGIARAVVGEDGRIASSDELKSMRQQLASLTTLLRLSHARQRFADKSDTSRWGA